MNIKSKGLIHDVYFVYIMNDCDTEFCFVRGLRNEVSLR